MTDNNREICPQTLTQKKKRTHTQVSCNANLQRHVIERPAITSPMHDCAFQFVCTIDEIAARIRSDRQRFCFLYFCIFVFFFGYHSRMRDWSVLIRQATNHPKWCAKEERKERKKKRKRQRKKKMINTVLFAGFFLFFTKSASFSNPAVLLFSFSAAELQLSNVMRAR